MDEVERKRIHLSQEISQVQVGREESKERSDVMAALEARQTQKKKLEKELEQYKSCDPHVLKTLRT